MPVEPDKNGGRALEIAIELPGTPEQVWQAIATGPGIGAWFVPSMVEEHVGGSVRFDLGGGMLSSGEVTVWQPPARFAYVEPNWSEGAPPLATEFTIEALDGGHCRLRLVHSIPGDDARWDDEIGGMESGWPGFLEVLRISLPHHGGQPPASVRPMGGFTGTVAAAWTDFTGRLGLAGARAGEVRTTSDGAPSLGGIVGRVARSDHQAEIGLRLTDPAPGVALLGAFGWGGEVRVAVSLFFYGDGCEATAARESARWAKWLAEHYPLQEGVG